MAAPPTAVISVLLRERVCIEQTHDSTGTRFLEPKPGGDQVGKGVVVGVLRDALKEVEIDSLTINMLDRDDEMGREPALGLDREERRELVPPGLEDRERLPPLTGGGPPSHNKTTP